MLGHSGGCWASVPVIFFAARLVGLTLWEMGLLSKLESETVLTT